MTGQPAAALSVLAAVVVITLAGCGSGERSPAGPAAPTSSSPAPAVVASGENWDFRAPGYQNGPIVLGTGYNPGGRIAALTGALDLSGTSITGLMTVWGGCFNDAQALFTGTRDGLALDMMSAPISGVTIRVTGTLSEDMRSFNGTFRASGVTCSSALQPMSGERAALDGVWRDDNLTMTIALSERPLVTGNFALSGPVVFADNPCGSEAMAVNIAGGRLVFPEIICGDKVYTFDGEVTPDLKQMRYTYFLSVGSCPGHLGGSGTLLRQ